MKREPLSSGLDLLFKSHIISTIFFLLASSLKAKKGYPYSNFLALSLPSDFYHYHHSHNIFVRQPISHDISMENSLALVLNKQSFQ